MHVHTASDDEARVAHLERHALLVRAHAVALSRKPYWDTFKPSPDFVIMFLPGEMLYTAAHWSDVGDKLEKAVGAYNKSVGALETLVLVTARKFVDLKAATADDGEVETPRLVDTLPRPLVAPELDRSAA